MDTGDKGMDDKLKSLIIKVVNTIWGKTIVGILFCFMFYLFRKSVVFSQSTLVVINIILGVLGLVAIYQIIHEKIIPLTRIILLIAIAFIWNQLYIPEFFYQAFHIQLKTACIWCGGMCIAIFCFMKFYEQIIGIFKWVGDIFFERIEDNKEKEMKRLQAQCEKNKIRQNRKTKLFSRKSQAGIRGIEGSEKNEEEQEVYNDDLQRELNGEKRTSWGDRFLYLIISILLILGPAIISIKMWNNDGMLLLEKISGSGLINSMFSLICLSALGIFIWTVLIGIIIKLVKTIFNIVKDKSSNYLFFAAGLLIISVYFLDQYNVTLDSLYDAIAKGDIFSYPLIIIVLLPIFLTFLESLHKYAETNKKKDKIVKLIHEIIIDIISSLLTMVKFVSSSYLISIINIVQEDMEDGDETEDEGRTRKCTDDGDDYDATKSEEGKEEKHS